MPFDHFVGKSFGDIYADKPKGKSEAPVDEEDQKEKLAALLKLLEKAGLEAQEAKDQKKLEELSKPKGVRVFIHGMDGTTMPIVLSPNGSVQVKTKDGYICAVITVDPTPVPLPAPKEDEPPPTARIVEV